MDNKKGYTSHVSCPKNNVEYDSRWLFDILCNNKTEY